MKRTLTHFNRDGSVRMVDVSSKPDTLREAVAAVEVEMSAGALRRLPLNPKGNPLEIARIAAIAAAKKTATLIPLCHTLLLSHVDVEARRRRGGVSIKAVVRSTGPTGVEMEALTAAAVAALTVYDMTKALDHGIEITRLRLLEKSGGKSGKYVRNKAGRNREASTS
ncbi:MAG: cyclic pyranopterin monophosphate synthase MoaC [Acidobacteriota bacterium]|nr:cyclic pyranopterin monophosphate synthase MoaC [Acidobacteriota bacterium]